MKKPSDFRDWSLDDPDYPENEGCGILWLLALLAAAGLAAVLYLQL